MPKGESPLLNGAVCKVLVNIARCVEYPNIASYSNGLAVVNLKQKLSIKVMFIILRNTSRFYIQTLTIFKNN